MRQSPCSETLSCRDVMPAELIIDSDLLRTFGVGTSEYVCYPPLHRFVPAFDASVYRRWLAERRERWPTRPLALCVHLPNDDPAGSSIPGGGVLVGDYRRSLEAEIRMLVRDLGHGRVIGRVRLGGCARPFPVDVAFAEEALAVIRSEFTLEPRGEYTVEVNAPIENVEGIARLGQLGFNHLCINVDGIDAGASTPRSGIEALPSMVRVAHANGFVSVAVALVGDLQDPDPRSFTTELDAVISCAPDRVTFRSSEEAVEESSARPGSRGYPATDAAHARMIAAADRLLGADFRYLGVDHFVRPHDDFALGHRLGRLIRDCGGYSVGPHRDVVGLGVGAIAQIGSTYGETVGDVRDYFRALAEGVLPVLRGIELTLDDLCRRSIIEALWCQFEVSIESISSAYLLDFERYFAHELRALEPLVRHDMLDIDPRWITLTPRGKLFVRAVCSVFDKYRRDREV